MTIIDFRNLNEEQTKRLNEIGEANKEKFTLFVDHYSKKYGNNYFWWATPLANRNIYLDDTFLLFCYFLLCIEIIEKDKGKIIVKASCNELKQCVEIYLRKNKVKNVVVECDDGRLQTLRTLFRTFEELFNRVKEYLLVKWAIRHYHYDYEKIDNVIDTPVLSSCFTEGKYYDRYFTDIQSFTAEKIVFLATLNRNSSISWQDFIKEVVQEKDYKFLVKEYYLKIVDYFELIKYVFFCYKISKDSFNYEGEDVTAIVRKSLHRGAYSIPSLKGVINRKFVQRVQEHGISIKNLIVWFEGRASCNMLVKAYRESYKEGRTVGYIGYPLTEFGLSKQVSTEQYKKKAVPEIIAIPSKADSLIVRQFCENLQTIEVPILRNSYRVSGRIKDKGHKKVLLILPFFEDKARHMLEYINKFTKNNRENLTILIKNHPAYAEKTLEFYYRDRLYFEPQFVNGLLLDVLKEVDIAVVSKTSSSIEVLCSNVYLINICAPGELNEPCIPQWAPASMYSNVYGFNEFEDAINQALRLEKNDWLKNDDAIPYVVATEESVGKLFDGTK